MIEQKKSKIPYFFFAFFAVVFAVDFFHIYLSQKTWRGVVTQDSYQKGLKYNEAIKLASQQKDLGWKMEIKYQKISSKEGKILVKIFDKNSKIIPNANVNLKLKRPTQEGFDFEEKTKFLENFYQAKIVFPLKGQWDVEVLATKGEDVFQEVKRYIIQ